jgi:hypothetical protein
MRVVVFLIAIGLVLFWILPLGIAIFGTVVVALLVAAKLHDAVRHGRAVIAARNNDENAESAVQGIYHRDAVFHAMWIGLTVSGIGHHHDSGSYVHGQHGSDLGGDFADGGGGDSGGI